MIEYIIIKKTLMRLSTPWKRRLWRKPASILLKVGRRICPEYGAVKEWDNRQYPQYFHNEGHYEKLLSRLG